MKLEDLKEAKIVWIPFGKSTYIYFTENGQVDEDNPGIIYFDSIEIDYNSETWYKYPQSYLSDKTIDESWYHMVSNCNPISDFPDNRKHITLKTILGGVRI